jgi:hypothetical protein
LIGHILRKNCLLKHITEEKNTKSDRSDGKKKKKRKQLLDDLTETRGYWELKEEELDGTFCETVFVRGNVPVLKQT